MENAPETVDPDELKDALVAAVPGVRDVHDVHCWSLTPGQTMLTLHLALDAEADPSLVLRQAKRLLVERYEVAHSALQLERDECPDAV
jgi:cobalt-zinc-cadmium efflux system protein